MSGNANKGKMPEEPAAAGGGVPKRVLPGKSREDREKKAAHKAALAAKKTAEAEPVAEANGPTPEQLKEIEHAKAVLRDARELVAQKIAAAKALANEARIATIGLTINRPQGKEAHQKWGEANRNLQAAEDFGVKLVAAALAQVEAAKKAAGM